MPAVFVQEWEPIETAPKDGTRVWVHVPSVVYLKKGRRCTTRARQIAVRWASEPGMGKGNRLSAHAIELVEKHGGFWCADRNGRHPISGHPTDWMPLPDPPETPLSDSPEET